MQAIKIVLSSLNFEVLPALMSVIASTRPGRTLISTSTR